MGLVEAVAVAALAAKLSVDYLVEVAVLTSPPEEATVQFVLFGALVSLSHLMLLKLLNYLLTINH
jgi:hypothetical protein